MRQSEFRGIRALLFDKDGTVIDYRKTWVPINRRIASVLSGGDARMAAQLLRLGGHDPDTDTVAAGSAFAAGTAAELANLFHPYIRGMTLAGLEQIIDRFFREGGTKGAVAEQGAAEAISALGALGYRCGLATNDSTGGMFASLRSAGLAGLFAFEVAADSGHGVKPDPGMALAFAEHLGIPARAIAVIGDSWHDLEMARRAGCGIAIGVLSGPARRSDLGPFADLVIDNVRELPALFSGG